MMGDRDEIRPDGLLDARRRMGPGDGYADDEDDVIGHGTVSYTHLTLPTNREV